MKMPARGLASFAKKNLQPFVKLTSRARNKDSAADSPLAVLHPLYDAGLLPALRTIRALGCVHHLLAITCFGDFSHGSKSPFSRVQDAMIFRGLRTRGEKSELGLELIRRAGRLPALKMRRAAYLNFFLFYPMPALLSGLRHLACSVAFGSNPFGAQASTIALANFAIVKYPSLSGVHFVSWF